MRLEPVYLLAPKPKPPSMPTRRAFLIAGGTFVAGVGLGGACGYAAGVSSGGEGAGGAEKVDEVFPKSGDADLDELRRLAVKAPIEELMGKRFDFLDRLSLTYRNDTIAWRGVGRIAEQTLADPNVENRRLLARFVSQVIEQGEPEVTHDLAQFIEDLRKVK